MTAPTVVSFAELGVMCYRDGVLAEGLELLAQRLDYAGAGELVAWLLSVEFTDSSKRDPKPVPTPKPPPSPSPTTPKGRR